MNGPRVFRCDRRGDSGIPHGVETRLFVQAPEYGDFGTCAGHAEEMLAAVTVVFGRAQLLVYKKQMVERWGAAEITVEDAVLGDSQAFGNRTCLRSSNCTKEDGHEGDCELGYP